MMTTISDFMRKYVKYIHTYTSSVTEPSFYIVRSYDNVQEIVNIEGKMLLWRILDYANSIEIDMRKEIPTDDARLIISIKHGAELLPQPLIGDFRKIFSHENIE